jgi:hypothetical protein
MKAIMQLDSRKDVELAYYPQLFVLLPFPYQDPKSMAFTRRYGDFNLSFVSQYGVPSGKAPRSLMSLITTQYQLQKNDIKDTVRRRIVTLGNIKAASVDMGYSSLTGGKTGTGTKLNKALEQLLGVMISTTATKVIGTYQCLAGENVRLFDAYKVFWNVAQKSKEPETVETYVRISPEFEQIIATHSIPVDINVYNSFNARQQDLYAWAVRRIFAINKGKRRDVLIPFDMILPQFFDKMNNKTKPHQKNELRLDLFEVKKNYPELNIESDNNGIILHPSRLHIDPQARGYV